MASPLAGSPGTAILSAVRKSSTASAHWQSFQMDLAAVHVEERKVRVQNLPRGQSVQGVLPAPHLGVGLGNLGARVRRVIHLDRLLEFLQGLFGLADVQVGDAPIEQQVPVRGSEPGALLVLADGVEPAFLFEPCKPQVEMRAGVLGSLLNHVLPERFVVGPHRRASVRADGASQQQRGAQHGQRLAIHADAAQQVHQRSAAGPEPRSTDAVPPAGP